MITVRNILAVKPADLFVVSATDSVHTALEMLARHKIGALMVTSGSDLVGIVSERDCAVKVTLRGLTARAVTVGEIMTADVITVDPTKHLEDCMREMTARDIRHLPVTEDGRILGMVSIGDVVKAVIREQELHISYLETYIKGHGRA